MQLQPIDKADYLKRSRVLSIILISCFAVIALGSAPILIHIFGNPEGGNFYLNLAGVGLGVAITGFAFSFFRHDPRLSEIWYVFSLKRMLARTTNRMHLLKKLAAAGDEDAIQILRFYYQGLSQVYQLESNEYGYTELNKEHEAFVAQLEERLKTAELVVVQPEFIESVAKRAA
ncbi:Protein of unknown function [Oceanospirillum multiglobuliferum]|uniref:DUF3087 domain-containing protein n=1 Tax=Oceanospirillum multiglobuliferum TaxID=64969 RepID=A0A1T4R9L5_9GAMM|nr:DUF3087 family protein [Oceanospirillum multiglobuliferum]OPX55131.1 hypothetical protein BTE48_10220 [Oceanospirillum multiglobuliferum]SKA12615.1 Protein of unknown function [Oceanospirillum multiglobuliferum]